MSYQSEAQLEQQLIDQLKGQGYDEVAIPDYDSLVANFRVQFEKFNAAKLVKPLSMASVAAGVDGLIIEVHNDPPHAMCDGQQSLTPEAFEEVVQNVAHLRDALKVG